MEIALFPAANATIDRARPDACLGGCRELRVGRDDFRKGPYRSLARFALPLGVGFPLASAKLDLYQVGSQPPGARPLIELYGLAGPWEERTVTWNTRPPRDHSPSASSETPAGPGWAEFDLTLLGQAWLGGARPNYGFILVASGQRAARLGVFAGRLSREPAILPRLRLRFEPPGPAHPVVTIDIGRLVTSDSWKASQPIDSAGLTTGTFFFSLAEGRAAEVRPECGFDGRAWCARCPPKLVDQTSLTPLVPLCYARYYRIGYRSATPGKRGAIQATFQGTA